MENNKNEIHLEKTSSLENNNDSIDYSSTIRHIYLNLNDEKNIDYKSKCTLMIIDFGEQAQNVDEVFFQNYYTYKVSVMVMKISNADPNGLKMWYTSIQKKKLMDDTHMEYKSQDFFSIKSSESTIDWSDLYKMKLILCQPSPNWENFGIDELKFLRTISHKN